MKAIFITADGSEHAVDVAPGTSLMRAATTNGIPGIVADCGGTASCATCHVLIDPSYATMLPAIEPNEDQMLDCTAAEREPTSRLSCQVMMAEGLDGIRVRIADPQL